MSIWRKPITKDEAELLYRVFGIELADSVVVEPEIKIARKVEELEKRIRDLEKKEV